MSKARGAWVATYEQLFVHAKTEEAVDLLLETWPKHEPVLRSVAVQVVCVGLLRLHFAALAKGCTDGRIRRPADHRFVAIAWPEYDAAAWGVPADVAGKLLLEALIAAGYVHEQAEGRIIELHEYRLYNAKILADRERDRAKREGAKGPSSDRSPTADREVSGRKAVSSSSSSSSSSSTSPNGEGSCPLAKIAKTWNEVAKAAGVPWVRHPKVPSGDPERFVRARWSELPDLKRWRAGMEAAARDDWWGGRKLGEDGKPWRAAIGSFARDSHFQRWTSEAEVTDWRSAGDHFTGFNLWWAEVQAEGLAAIDLAYTGEWPLNDQLTPRQAEDALVEIMAWFQEVIWPTREDA